MNRRHSAVAVLAVVLVLGSMVGLWLLLGNRTSERDQSQAVTLSLSQQLVALCENTEDPQAQALRDAGVCEDAQQATEDVGNGDVPDPILIPGPPGPQGPAGVPGASCVAEYGFSACRGAPGADGRRGQDGADSTVPGPSGEDGQEGPRGLSCVEDLGLDECRGPAGPKGDQGDPGQQGPPGQDGADGQPGTAQPGTYTCPAGEFVEGFTVAADGTVTLDCAPPLLP